MTASTTWHEYQFVKLLLTSNSVSLNDQIQTGYNSLYMYMYFALLYASLKIFKFYMTFSLLVGDIRNVNCCAQTDTDRRYMQEYSILTHVCLVDSAHPYKLDESIFYLWGVWCTLDIKGLTSNKIHWLYSEIIHRNAQEHAFSVFKLHGIKIWKEIIPKAVNIHLHFIIHNSFRFRKRFLMKVKRKRNNF